jgi:hypothetical protein
MMKTDSGDWFLMEALREAGFDVKRIKTGPGKKVVTIEKAAIRKWETPREPVLHIVGKEDR